MNGRELSKPSIHECPLSSEQDSRPSDEDRSETWAAVVAGCQQTVPVVPPPMIALGTASDFAAPEGWRPSVGALTPTFATASPSSGLDRSAVASSSRADESLNRIQMRVNTQECGEVAVVVERAETGLRVLIAAENPLAANTLHREATAMRNALESGGHNIVSLKIIGMEQYGTELAKDGLTPRNDKRGTKKANGTDSKTRAAEMAAQRLRIIG